MIQRDCTHIWVFPPTSSMTSTLSLIRENYLHNNSNKLPNVILHYSVLGVFLEGGGGGLVFFDFIVLFFN